MIIQAVIRSLLRSCEKITYLFNAQDGLDLNVPEGEKAEKYWVFRAFRRGTFKR